MSATEVQPVFWLYNEPLMALLPSYWQSEALMDMGGLPFSVDDDVDILENVNGHCLPVNTISAVRIRRSPSRSRARPLDAGLMSGAFTRASKSKSASQAQSTTFAKICLLGPQLIPFAFRKRCRQRY